MSLVDRTRYLDKWLETTLGSPSFSTMLQQLSRINFSSKLQQQFTGSIAAILSHEVESLKENKLALVSFTSANFGLSIVPESILLHILGNLNPNSFISIGYVSHFFQDTVRKCFKIHRAWIDMPQFQISNYLSESKIMLNFARKSKLFNDMRFFSQGIDILTKAPAVAIDITDYSFLAYVTPEQDGDTALEDKRIVARIVDLSELQVQCHWFIDTVIWDSTSISHKIDNEMFPNVKHLWVGNVPKHFKWSIRLKSVTSIRIANPKKVHTSLFTACCDTLSEVVLQFQSHVLHRFMIGQQIDGYHAGRWRECRVEEIVANQIQISYQGWNTQRIERWVDKHSDEIAPHGTHTYVNPGYSDTSWSQLNSSQAIQNSNVRSDVANLLLALQNCPNLKTLVFCLPKWYVDIFNRELYRVKLENECRLLVNNQFLDVLVFTPELAPNATYSFFAWGWTEFGY